MSDIQTTISLEHQIPNNQNAPIIVVPLSEYKKLMQEKKDAEEKYKTLEQKIIELNISHQDSSNNLKIIIANHEQVIQQLKKEKAELHKIIDKLNGEIDKLNGKINKLNKKNIELNDDIVKINKKCDNLLYETQVYKIKTILQDFNAELRLESNLKPPLSTNMKFLRDDRNDSSHCWVSTDSIYIKEYKKYESILLLENLSPDLKDDIEHEYRYTEGFLDEIISTIRKEIGNIEDNPNYDLSKINPRDRKQADRWFSPLKK